MNTTKKSKNNTEHPKKIISSQVLLQDLRKIFNKLRLFETQHLFRNRTLVFKIKEKPK